MLSNVLPGLYALILALYRLAAVEAAFVGRACDGPLQLTHAVVEDRG